MSRLINADNLAERVRMLFSGEQPILMATILDYIKQAPTVDAVPVVKGKWVQVVDRDFACYSCSLCDGYVGNVYLSEYHYCPNCGAKMEDEE